MKINSSKSCVVKICKTMTVLGVILNPDLKLSANTVYICKKAYKNMWMVRRMKVIGLDTFTMMDYFMKEIRVHLDLAVPVWQSGLTLKLSADLKRVQRFAVSILLTATAMNLPVLCCREEQDLLEILHLELFRVKILYPDLD